MCLCVHRVSMVTEAAANRMECSLSLELSSLPWKGLRLCVIVF